MEVVVVDIGNYFDFQLASLVPDPDTEKGLDSCEKFLFVEKNDLFCSYDLIDLLE